MGGFGWALGAWGALYKVLVHPDKDQLALSITDRLKRQALDFIGCGVTFALRPFWQFVGRDLEPRVELADHRQQQMLLNKLFSRYNQNDLSDPNSLWAIIFSRSFCRTGPDFVGGAFQRSIRTNILNTGIVPL
jgi:hypothetical protein